LKRKAPSAPALAYRLFPPSGTPHVAALMTTGYFENMKRYRATIDRWNERGILVAAYDLRGHGLSEGERGFVRRFDDYVDDVLELLGELAHQKAWKALAPPILFGHSLGGLISIHVALRAPSHIAALALSSPYLERAKQAPAIKVAAGHMLSLLLPKVSVPAEVRGSECTRSTEIAEAYDRDPLNFHKANVRWFTETEGAQKRALERARELKLPIYCLQGGADLIALPAATDRFMQSVGSIDRHYERLPGVYHEILNEPERSTFMNHYAAAMLGWQPTVASIPTEA
jgi:alpha-beta hydrolase superfamily lysophospholipase